jgi:hypothetical protein
VPGQDHDAVLDRYTDMTAVEAWIELKLVKDVLTESGLTHDWPQEFRRANKRHLPHSRRKHIDPNQPDACYLLDLRQNSTPPHGYQNACAADVFDSSDEIVQRKCQAIFTVVTDGIVSGATGEFRKTASGRQADPGKSGKANPSIMLRHLNARAIRLSLCCSLVLAPPSCDG